VRSSLCTRGCGCGQSIRHSLRPPFFRGWCLAHPGRFEPRECEGVSEACPIVRNASLGWLLKMRPMHAGNAQPSWRGARPSRNHPKGREGPCVLRMMFASPGEPRGLNALFDKVKTEGNGSAFASVGAGGRNASLLHWTSRGCVARQEPYIPGALSIL
jgi:hypothetical protein